MDNLRELDNRNIMKVFGGEPFRCLVIGSSQSGKSFFMTQKVLPMIQHQYDRVFIFTRKTNVSYYTKQTWDWKANEDKRKYLNSSWAYRQVFDMPKSDRFVHFVTDFDKFIPMIRVIEKTQEVNCIKGGNEKDGDDKYKYRVLVLFDDILNEKLNKDQTIVDMFSNFRHINVSTIMIVQVSTVLISSLQKNNSGIAVIAKMISDDMRRRTLKEFVKNSVKKSVLDDDDDVNTETKRIYGDVVEQYDHGILISHLDTGVLYYHVDELEHRDVVGWNRKFL